jgi:hypothetical protein
MRANHTSGAGQGVPGNRHSYCDNLFLIFVHIDAKMCHGWSPCWWHCPRASLVALEAATAGYPAASLHLYSGDRPHDQYHRTALLEELAG